MHDNFWQNKLHDFVRFTSLSQPCCRKQTVGNNLTRTHVKSFFERKGGPYFYKSRVRQLTRLVLASTNSVVWWPCQCPVWITCWPSDEREQTSFKSDVTALGSISFRKLTVHPPEGSRAQADVATKGVKLKFARIMTASGSFLIRLIPWNGPRDSTWVPFQGVVLIASITRC